MKLKNYLQKAIILFLSAAFFSACNENEDNTNNLNEMTVKMAVISDPHYFSPELLVNNGSAFQEYLAKDRKLLAESAAILESALTMVKAENPEILLVSGDLTKDGELRSHEELADYFTELEAEGVQVFVCPGNHDINNPHAMKFDGETATSVESVTADQFKDIYADFGYGEALAFDPNSLSYVAEPVDGLWIISIDVCVYDNNTEEPATYGQFKPTTLNWVKEQLTLAKSKNKRVLGMMHHGLVEHFPGQKTLFSEYVIENWESVSTDLAEGGLNFVFTGHFHAQDIIKKESSTGFVYDIETGSLVTFPCPIRIVNIDKGHTISLSTKKVENIDYDLGDAINFESYATEYLSTGLDNVMTYILMNPPYSLPNEQIQFLLPALKEAFIAHYSGDEPAPSVSTQTVIAMLSSGDATQQMMSEVMQGIFDDPAPNDNSLKVDFVSGSIAE